MTKNEKSLLQRKRSSRRRKSFFRLLIVLITILFGVLLLAYLANLFLGEGEITAFFQDFTKKNKALSYVLFLLLTPIINIIPGISSMFTIGLANMLFNYKTAKDMLITFLLSATSVILTSSLMFLLGRYGGKRIIRWILGREEQEKIQKYLTWGGKAVIPMMYLLPFFPDDTLSLVAGLTNMSFLYNFVCTLIFRNFGVLFMCVLGTDFFDYKNFSPALWTLLTVLFLLALLFLSFLSFLYYRHLRFKEEGVKYYLISLLKIKRIVRIEKVKRKDLKKVPLPEGEGLSSKEKEKLRRLCFLDGSLYQLHREKGEVGYFLLQDGLKETELSSLSKAEKESDYLVYEEISFDDEKDFLLSLKLAKEKESNLYVRDKKEKRKDLLMKEGMRLVLKDGEESLYQFQAREETLSPLKRS